jgi:hypothetical protein
MPVTLVHRTLKDGLVFSDSLSVWPPPSPEIRASIA